MEKSHLLEDSKMLKRFSSACLKKLDAAKVNELIKANQSRHFLSLKLVQRPEQANKTNGFFSIDDCFEDAEIVSNLQKEKYQNFTLKEWEIDVDHSMKADPTLNNRFWTSVAPYMTTLTLNHCKIYQNGSLLPGNFWHKVPFLKSLTLLNCRFISRQDGGIEFERSLEDWMSVQQERIEHLKGRRTKLQLKLAATGKNPDLIYFNTIIKKLEHVQSYLKGVEDRLEDLRDQRRGYPGYRNLPHLNGLRSLCVQSTDNPWMPLDIDYGNVVNLFPNLEKIVIRMEIFYECTSSPVSDGRVLKELDVMQTETFFTEMPPVSMLTLPAESLTFGCGLEATAEKVGSVLESQAVNLRKLNLFRAPYAEPYSSIPCNRIMYLLNELELWGTVTGNLNFLQFMPNLRQFKWSTNCYDEETHGARLHQALGQAGFHLMHANDIVLTSDELGDDFKLTTLSTFELECGVLRLDSVKKLGKWFPNLRTLKVVVTGQDELTQIGHQWYALEHLELAHGSYVAPDTILRICSSYGGFRSLKNFTWKGCPCYMEKFETVHLLAQHTLRKRLRQNPVLAWTEDYWKPLLNKSSTTECVRLLYEKALNYGKKDALYFRKFLNSLSE